MSLQTLNIGSSKKQVECNEDVFSIPQKDILVKLIILAFVFSYVLASKQPAP